MPLIGFSKLHDDADERRPAIPVVAAGAADLTVLEALRIATDRGWIQPIAVGEAREIRSMAAARNISLDGFRIVDSEPDRIANDAVAEVKSGRAAILMKGRISTPDLMHVVLDPEIGIRSGRSVAQVVLMEIPRDSRRFLLADTGIMIKPKLVRNWSFAKSRSVL